MKFPTDEEVESVISEVAASEGVLNADHGEGHTCDFCQFCNHLDGHTLVKGQISVVDKVFSQMMSGLGPLMLAAEMFHMVKPLVDLCRMCFLLGVKVGKRQSYDEILQGTIKE